MNRPLRPQRDISTDVTLPHPTGRYKRRAEFELPTHIAGYKLGEQIGEGGQCVVYRGKRDYIDSILPEDIAIKCLLADVGESQDILEAGFHEERDILSQLAHPNIVESYGSGRLHHPRIEYILLELCEGDADALNVTSPAGRVPIATSIVYDIATGLDYVHGSDILHRDVKPKNILLTAHGVAKLCDFGLASSGRIGGIRGAGTPQYMSPEKLRESADTPESDIYGLGASLWHLITGKPPFNGLSVDRMVREIMEYGLPELSGSDAPDDLRLLIKDMTRRKPQNRAGLERTLEICDKYRGHFDPVFRAA